MAFSLQLPESWLPVGCFVLFFNLNQPQKQFSPFLCDSMINNLLKPHFTWSLSYYFTPGSAWAAVVSQARQGHRGWILARLHSLSTLLPKCCCTLNSKSSSLSFFLLSSLVYSLLQILSIQDFNYRPFENDIEISALRPNLVPKFQTHVVVSWTISLKIFKIWIIFQMARFANALWMIQYPNQWAVSRKLVKRGFSKSWFSNWKKIPQSAIGQNLWSTFVTNKIAICMTLILGEKFM